MKKKTASILPKNHKNWLARLILASSDEEDIVLDPFMGGGSTALACINNKRNYIGFEIEQEYYEKSLERLACRQMALL